MPENDPRVEELRKRLSVVNPDQPPINTTDIILSEDERVNKLRAKFDPSYKQALEKKALDEFNQRGQVGKFVQGMSATEKELTGAAGVTIGQAVYDIGSLLGKDDKRLEQFYNLYKKGQINTESDDPIYYRGKSQDVQNAIDALRRSQGSILKDPQPSFRRAGSAALLLPKRDKETQRFSDVEQSLISQKDNYDVIAETLEKFKTMPQAVVAGKEAIIEDTPAERLLKGSERRIEDAPIGEGAAYNAGRMVAQIIPQAAAIAIAPFTSGTSLAFLPGAIGASYLTGITLSSAGSGMREYKRYQTENNLEIDDKEMWGIGFLSAVSELGPEAIRFGSIMKPIKALMGSKISKEMIKKFPGVGRDLIERMAKSNPQAYKRFIARIASNSTEEGIEEAITELAQAGIETMYKKPEDWVGWKDLLKNIGRAFGQGVMMGGLLGGVQSWSITKMQKDARKKNGKVILIEDQADGKVYELVNLTDKGAVGVDGYGNPTTLKNPGVTIDLTIDEFNNFMSQWPKSQEEGRKLEREILTSKAKENIDTHIGLVTNVSTGEIIQVQGNDGEIYYVVHGNPDDKTPGSMPMWINHEDPGGELLPVDYTNIKEINRLSPKEYSAILNEKASEDMTNAELIKDEKQQLDQQLNQTPVIEEGDEVVFDGKPYIINSIDAEKDTYTMQSFDENGQIEESQVLPSNVIQLSRKKAQIESDFQNVEDEATKLEQNITDEQSVQQQQAEQAPPSFDVNIGEKELTPAVQQDDGTFIVQWETDDISKAENKQKKLQKKLEMRGFDVNILEYRVDPENPLSDDVYKLQIIPKQEVQQKQEQPVSQTLPEKLEQSIDKKFEKLKSEQSIVEQPAEAEQVSPEDQIEVEPEQIQNDPEKLHNRLANEVNNFNKISESNVNQRNEVRKTIDLITAELGYSIKWDNKKLIALNKSGKKVVSKQTQSDKDYIQQHKVLSDYGSEFKTFLERILINPANLKNLEVGGLNPKEKDSALNAVLNEKKTGAANTLLDVFEYIYENKTVSLKEEGFDIGKYKDYPLENIFGLEGEKSLPDPDKLIGFETVDEKILDELISRGITTKEDLEKARESMFTGYPYTDEDFNNVLNTFNNAEQYQKFIEKAERRVTEEETGQAGETSQRVQAVSEAAEQVISVTTKEDIEIAVKEININPTEAQKAAGNYKKAHISLHGMPITIENAKGSTRTGTDEKGDKWESKMYSHYGYFKRSKGHDGDEIDLFIGDNPESTKIFVVDQVNPKTKEFDEHKVLVGFNTLEEAKEGYLANYDEGWQGLGEITETDIPTIKEWVGNGTKKQKEFANYKHIQDGTTKTTITKPVQEQHIQEDNKDTAISKPKEEKAGTEEKRLLDQIKDNITKIKERRSNIANQIEQKRNELSGRNVLFEEESPFAGQLFETEKDFSGKNFDQVVAPLRKELLEVEEEIKRAEQSAEQGVKEAKGQKEIELSEKNDDIKTRVAKSAAETTLQELLQKGSLRVADPKSIAEKIKEHTGVEVEADQEVGVVRIVKESEGQQEVFNENKPVQDLTIEKLKSEISVLDEEIKKWEDYNRKSNTQILDFGSTLLGEEKNDRYQDLTGELHRRTSISSEEAKKKVKKKREERLKYNDVKEPSETYKTQDGKQISFNSYGDKIIDTELKEKIQNPSLRKLKDGEFANVERKYTVDKNYVFKGGKIESIDDVAYLFSNLETASVENVFFSLVKNGKPIIIHHSMGGLSGTVVDITGITDAITRFNPDKVYFVHNHPSGNINPSKSDRTLLDKLQTAFPGLFEDGIIINITSGFYGTFNTSSEMRNISPKAGEGFKFNAYKFDKQVFSKDVKDFGQIRTSKDIARIISAFRLSSGNKLGVLIMSTKNIIQANLALQNEISDGNIENLYKEIAAYTSRFVGKSIVLYGREKMPELEMNSLIKRLQTQLKKQDINILDAVFTNNDPNIDVYKSYKDEALIFEPESKFKKEAAPEFAGDILKKDDIRSKKTTPTELEKVPLKMVQDKKDKFMEALADKKLAIRKWQDWITEHGGKVTDGSNPWMDENLSIGRALNEQKKYEKNIEKPFLAEIINLTKETGKSHNEVSRYMIAKHAPERNKYIRDQKIEDGKSVTDEDIFAGLSDEAANEIVEKFESKAKKESIDKFWKAKKKATDFVLNTWKKYGFIDYKQIIVLYKRYKYYVPLQGWEKQVDDIFEYQQNSIGGLNLIKKAEGRTTLSDDPIPYMLNMAHSAIVAGEKNEVKQTAFSLVNHNKELLRDIVTAIPVYQVRTGVIDKDGIEEVIETIVKPSKELFDEGKVVKKYSNKHKIRKTPYDAKEHEVELYIGGDKYVLAFEDPAIARALNNEDVNKTLQEVTRLATKYPGVVTRYLSRVYTSLNPDFIITNMARDIPLAMISHYVEGDIATTGKLVNNLRKSNKAIIKYARGKADAKNNYVDRMYQLFKDLGGETGYVHLRDIEAFKRRIKNNIRRSKQGKMNPFKLLRHGIEAVEGMAEWSENLTRFATFLTSVEKGKSYKQAAFDAKNVTVNFNRSGRYSGIMGSFFAFFNAGVRGVVRYGELWQASASKMATVHAVIMAQGYLVSLMLDLWGGEDEEEKRKYDRISDFKKDNYLLFNLPGEDDYASVPMPHVFRFFHSLGVISYDLATDRITPEKAIKKALANLPKDAVPIDLGASINKEGELSGRFAVPTGLMPIYDLWLNENFMGSKIYKEPFTLTEKSLVADSRRHFKNVNKGVKKLTDSLYKLTGSTSGRKTIYDRETKMYKKIPDLMDLNPEYIEHLAEGYFGGTGKFINQIIKTASNIVDASNELAEDKSFKEIIKHIDLNDLPIAHRFFGRAYKDLVKEEFYSLKDKYSILNDLIRSYKETDPEIADAIMRDHVGVFIFPKLETAIKKISAVDELLYLTDNKDQIKQLEKEKRDLMKLTIKLLSHE